MAQRVPKSKQAAERPNPEPLRLRHTRANAGRVAAYLLVLAGGCALSMFAAYHAVRFAARSMNAPPAPHATANIEEARALRAFSNELARLLGEYMNRIPDGVRPIERDFDQWAAQEFRPRLNDLRARMAGSPTGGTRLGPLMAAADRTAAMAAHPADTTLRRRAATEVLSATASVEQYIAAMGIPPYALEPAVVPELPPGEFR